VAKEAGDLRAKILLAALHCSGGDLAKTFTAEELLVAAWEEDPMAFGLRGFERQHPASEVIHREIGKRGPGTQSMVEMGLLEWVDSRVYRLTLKGLQRASELTPDSSETREKANRELEARLSRLLGHRVFQSWLRDSTSPRSFRDAGQFWGIAAGTPARVIKERIALVDSLLDSAEAELDGRSVDQMVDKHERVLFERVDLQRVREFQQTLKDRFLSDLQLLKVQLD
jgi:hypothetical protein